MTSTEDLIKEHLQAHIKEFHVKKDDPADPDITRAEIAMMSKEDYAKNRGRILKQITQNRIK